MFKRLFRQIPRQYFAVGAFVGYKGVQNQLVFANDKEQIQLNNDSQINESQINETLEQKSNNLQQKESQNLIQMKLCDSDQIKEHEIHNFQIGKEQYNIIVVRIQGKLYCVGGTCTYDDKTLLKDGEIFNNKIYCPQHGCAYNAQSGSVEYAPAIDNLPKFYIKEVNGKVILYFPKNPPFKLEAQTLIRDQDDLRKVVVIGSGVAAFQAILTLRSHGYTGEITMVSKDSKLPYDKTQLTKQIKNINYDDLMFKKDDWYDKLDINYQLGQEIDYVVNDHGAPHYFLKDGNRMEYDALLVCTGENLIVRNIPVFLLFKQGIAQKSNLLFLNSIQDSMILQSLLSQQENKNLAVLGLSLKSLEAVSTLRQEYPDINITLIDDNEQTNLQDQLGDIVSKQLVDQHRKKGIKFYFQRQIQKFLGDEQKVEQIQLNSGEQIETDLVLCFPNNSTANTKFIDDSFKIDNIEFDKKGRVKVNYFMRSGFYKYIQSTKEYFLRENAVQ